MGHATTTLLAISNSALAALAAGILVACIVATIVLRRRRQSDWQRFAANRGLRFARSGGRPRIAGRVGGRGMSLEVLDESSDTGALGVEEMRMALDVVCPHWPLGLRVESATGVIGDFEANRIATGNESFDRDLLVTGSDRASACGWLTSDRQFALMNLAAKHSDKRLTLDGERLALQTRNAISRLQQLDDMLDSLVRAADALELREDDPQGGADQADTLSSTRQTT